MQKKNSYETSSSSSCRAISMDISLTLSRHPSLSFIASGRSSGLHPVSTQSCCMLVRAGHTAFAWPCEGVHRSTSLMSSSLLLQQCPACLVRLTLIVFIMGGRCFWQMHPPKPKPYCIVWNEPLQALASMSMHTKQNLIKQTISPH